ncbi:PadR family transcriptional regulator [candidate division KSB1 bacterium]
MKFLSRQEEILLLAILKLKETAYGVTIRELVSESTQKYWSIGAIYDILDRLERKGLVKPIIGEPTAERGGKSKRYYAVTKEGHRALEEVRTLQNEMWSGIPKTATD